MKSKIKILIIIGYSLTVILFILRQQQSGVVSFMGAKAFKVGNKTVKYKPSPGFKYYTDQDSIKNLITLEDIAFLVTGDSISNHQTVLFGDYLTMGEIDTFDELLEILNQDSSMITISKDISTSLLTLKQKTVVDSTENVNYLLTRYYNCYPYYLRLRSVWTGSEKTPSEIQKLFNSFEVGK